MPIPPQHGAMRPILKNLFQPLPLAGVLTILTVGYSLRFAEPANRPASPSAPWSGLTARRPAMTAS